VLLDRWFRQQYRQINKLRMNFLLSFLPFSCRQIFQLVLLVWSLFISLFALICGLEKKNSEKEKGTEHELGRPEGWKWREERTDLRSIDHNHGCRRVTDKLCSLTRLMSVRIRLDLFPVNEKQRRWTVIETHYQKSAGESEWKREDCHYPDRDESDSSLILHQIIITTGADNQSNLSLRRWTPRSIFIIWFESEKMTDWIAKKFNSVNR